MHSMASRMATAVGSLSLRYRCANTNLAGRGGWLRIQLEGGRWVEAYYIPHPQYPIRISHITPHTIPHTLPHLYTPYPHPSYTPTLQTPPHTPPHTPTPPWLPHRVRCTPHPDKRDPTSSEGGANTANSGSMIFTSPEEGSTITAPVGGSGVGVE